MLLHAATDSFPQTFPSFQSVSFFSIPFFTSFFPFHTRVCIIMCTPFSLSFPFAVFMFYNMFHNQPLTYLFSFYSKINIEIFCLYRKKAYFCIRLAREVSLKLTRWFEEHRWNKKVLKKFDVFLVVWNKRFIFAKHFREKTEIDVNEFFERFKINKQVVQAGAPYVIYIWCTEKTRTVNIDIDRFGILEQIINWIVGKDIITMKSLILAQDER